MTFVTHKPGTTVATKALRTTLTLAACAALLPASAVAQSPVFLGAAAAAPPRAATLGAGSTPIPFRNGFPVIINGSGPFLFHLNPGAPSAFYMDEALTQELGLPVLTHLRFRLLDATSPSSGRYVNIVRAEEMHVAGAELHDLRGISTPQDKSTVLGIGAFHGMLVTLDFPHDRLTLSTEKLANPDERTVFRFAGDETTPVIPITLNGAAMTAHIEASAEDMDGDLMVPIDLGKKLPLLTPMREYGYFEDGIGRTWVRFVSTLNGDLVFGSTTVHNPTLVISNRVPYVNLAGICRRMLIRLDIDDRLVELKMADNAH